MGRRKSYIPRTFETMNNGSNKRESYSSIYRTMALSPAFKALTKNQRLLYMYCKLEYRGERVHGYSDDHFTMNQWKWSEFFELYAKNSPSFYKDMSALIEKGFIDCVSCGATTMKKSIYKFSDRWRLYGTPNFKIPNNVKTTGMLRKERSGKATR